MFSNQHEMLGKGGDYTNSMLTSSLNECSNKFSYIFTLSNDFQYVLKLLCQSLLKQSLLNNCVCLARMTYIYRVKSGDKLSFEFEKQFDDVRVVVLCCQMQRCLAMLSTIYS